MEASALPASVGLARTRIAIGAPLLRLRSDEQLVSLFRAGNDDAFRAIHDRYRARMLAYARQMLAGSPQDPEDAVQEVFVRAYAGLRANHRKLALRAWLYRIAHNRCIDELRRPRPPVLEAIDELIPAAHDPVAKAEQRDSLRRLIADVQRLPEQQRSALLMRELAGMPYADVSGALGVSVAAVKSLLVRARIGLAQASEARDTACAHIREDLISSHDRGVRTSGLARRHMRDCSNCRQFRSEVRGVSRRFAALTPTLGPLGVVANLLGWGGGAAAGGGAVAGGSAAVAGSGAAASGVLAGSGGHVVTILAAAIVATGGAVEIQHTLGAQTQHRSHHHRIAGPPMASPAPSSSPSESVPASVSSVASAPVDIEPAASSPPSAGAAPAPPPAAPRPSSSTPARSHHTAGAGSDPTKALPLSQTMDPDTMMNTANNPTSTATGSASGTGASTTGTPGTTPATGTGATPSGSPPVATGTGAPTGGTPGSTGTGAGAPVGGTPTGGGATPTGGSSATGSGGVTGTGSSTPPPSGRSPTGVGRLSTFVVHSS